MISHGDFGIFINRPVSMIFLLGTVIFLIGPLIWLVFKKTKKGGI
jgi:TctA family transporter